MRWFAIFVVACSLFLTATVYAADKIISPLPDELDLPRLVADYHPVVTFGDLLHAIPDTEGAITATPAATIIEVATPSPTLAPTLSPSPTPTPEETVIRATKKRSYTISLVGDSMIDTLGPVGGGLAARLNAIYPNTTFTVINHGVGAENIDSGLRRLTNGYSYLGIGRNSVVSEKPDIVVIESFGYNPYPLPDINDALTTHWLRLAGMVDTVKRELPEAKIVLAATIAPNRDVFGDGAPGLSFSPEGKRTKTEEIKRYIENLIAFAKSQNLPLADAYHPSMDATENGKVGYINAGDHIHYSDSGRSLFAQVLANTIIAKRLLE